MQETMDQGSQQSCDNYNLTVSTKKRQEVVHQSVPEKPYNESTITANGQKLKVVGKLNEPTWEALSPDAITAMTEKPRGHLEDSVQMFGSVMESSLTAR